MTDKINEKVISLFDKHKKELPICEDDKVITTHDGYPYICVRRDENGKHFDEEKLIDYSNECQYIVKVMVKHYGAPHINNFKVSGENLLKFLSLYINGEREGKVIEIDKYYAGGLA